MDKGWKAQGDLGEASAIEWLARAGATVFIPVLSAPDYDLIADFGGRVDRVQVKTSTCRARGRFIVQLRTRGGNQSWTGTVKYLGPDRCDRLFVHTGDGRRWFIPVSALGGRSAIAVGGPKYSEFEVEPGGPLPLFTRAIEEAAP
jgi:PD-(D/E)XK nuclease superfamily protein